MRQFYGVDMSCLDDRYKREQKEYYLETSAWADVHPSQMLGPPATLKEYDLLTITLEELAQPLRVGDLCSSGDTDLLFRVGELSPFGDNYSLSMWVLPLRVGDYLPLVTNYHCQCG